MLIFHGGLHCLFTFAHILSSDFKNGDLTCLHDPKEQICLHVRQVQRVHIGSI